MQLMRRVALNGVWLDEVDSRIVISGIEPGDGRENITAVDAASGFGQRITGMHRSTLDMVIRFKMLEHGKNVDGLTERAQLLEKINAWAMNGGALTVNYKPNRRLNVILVQAPGEGSLWDYTKEFTMTFRAYGVPYWEDDTAQRYTFAGTVASASRSYQVDGSVKTQIDVELANTSGMEINTASVTVDGNTLSFSSLGLAGGETLVIDHNDGLLRIRIRNGSSYRSAMAKRTATSADDLKARPGGTRGFSFSAQRACRMTASWRSRYL